VPRGRQYCRKHADELEPETAPINPAAIEFERRLLEGDYHALFGEALREVIEQAAAEPACADEIGVLRVVIARLMVTEQDAGRLAELIPRLASVAIQAARARQGGDADLQQLREESLEIVAKLTNAEESKEVPNG
jgi:hypothetical protein